MGTIASRITTSNPREIALVVLSRLQDRDTDATQLLHELLRRGAVQGPDARLATELTLGVLRNRSRLDAVLETMTRRPWRRTPPIVRDLLRLGAYQLLLTDRIPDHAAVNETVALARRWGSAGQASLVNAVLRRLTRRDPPADFDAVPVRSGWPRFYSHPSWLVRYLSEAYTEEQVVALLECNNRKPRLMLRANRLRTTAERLARRLADEGYEIAGVGTPTPETIVLSGTVGDVSSAGWFADGLATVQDGAAQLVSRLLAPRPGERVVDWCAAPGGKTTHLAELADDRATILAFDLDPDRLAQVAIHAERLGLRSIRTHHLRPEAIEWLRKNPADAILLDVPCSGLGTIQRHPDIRWRRRKKDLERAARVQREILAAAADCVAPGGRLVYSTCTLGPIENEHVVEQFLARHNQFERAAGTDPSDLVLLPFLDERGDLRTWPPGDGIDGFFAARLVRKR